MTRAEKLERFVHAGEAVQVATSMGALAGELAGLSAEIVDAETAQLWISERPRETIELVTLPGRQRRLTSLPGTVAGMVVLSGRTYRLEHPASHPLFGEERRQPDGESTRSVLATPLWIAREVRGVLVARNKRTGSFDEEDEVLFRSFSGIAAGGLASIAPDGAHEERPVKSRG